MNNVNTLIRGKCKDRRGGGVEADEGMRMGSWMMVMGREVRARLEATECAINCLTYLKANQTPNLFLRGEDTSSSSSSIKLIDPHRVGECNGYSRGHNG